ncbi:MAG: tRNA pseudouridine(38-40) synthase TruA [Promethearchaeota archaeon]|nr:MAG: tRNA pseudouridine(38-40) synthase TruA [Candidatus Lokiarchaeota archaeon]
MSLKSENLKKYFFKIYYIGKQKYHGSQRQSNVLTIEDQLIDILIKRNYIDDLERAEFEFASRTDRYVSARGAVFSIIPKKKPILMEINSFLPCEMGLWASSPVPINYSPRYHAVSRHYRYIFPEPLDYLISEYNFNIDIVKKACSQLEGIHNFQNFSKRDNSIEDTIRELNFVNMTISNNTVFIDFISKSFLRQQIRRIIKKLMELGKNEISFEEFLTLFDAKKFVSYEPANPNGLILWDIQYNSNIKFQINKKSVERMQNYFVTQKQKNWLKFKLFSRLEEDYLR